MVSESVSYWQRTAPDFLLSTELPPSVDVAIVGGGLLGAATCYWLARAGADVALLERTALAAGATGRNGGFMRAGPAGSYVDAMARLGHETACQVMEITLESRTLLRQVLQEEEIACDYREPGTLRFAITEARGEQYRYEIATLRHEGFPAVWLDRAHVQDILKTSLGPEILGARYRPEQGLVHLVARGYCQLSDNCRGNRLKFGVKVGSQPKFCWKESLLKRLKWRHSGENSSRGKFKLTIPN